MVAEPIRNKLHLRKMAKYCLERKNYRNHAMIVLGVHTALRISDLLRLTWNDVYDFERDEYRSHVALIEKKTGKKKTIALNKQVIAALRAYFPHRRGNSLFPNNRKSSNAISRVQAYRIIRMIADAVGITDRISCHSLRKTFGYHAWKSGVAAVLLMDIFNHSSFDITRRYLGISQDDRDSVYLGLALV